VLIEFIPCSCPNELTSIDDTEKRDLNILLSNYPVYIREAHYSDPDNEDRMILVWGLLVGVDGNECEGTCDGEFILHRITKHFDCK